MNILVVDDSPVIRKSLEEVLVSAGYSVTTAPDGVQGLEVIREKDFDLLFLDIDMPNLSGLQVCRMLRNDPNFAELPIVMLTARDQKKDQYWGMETGATEYLTKPFDPDDLLDKVEELLESVKKVAVIKPKPAKPLPEIELDEEKDVIFKAGELQETQLFKMSLINRIHQIAIGRDDLPTTCGYLADLYASVIDFDLAIFLITDEDRIKLFVFIKNPLAREFFKEARKSMINEYKKNSGITNIQWDNVEVEVNDPDHNMLKDDGSTTIRGLKMAMLESQGEKYGMYTMARGKQGPFSDDEIEMCNIITGQSQIVLDNLRMYERIKRYAIADGLTGLHNHRYFQEQLEKEYSRARRFNLSLSLILLDIDHFKNFNDTYGHQQGDMILKGIALILKRCVRDIDLAARYGGEEFAVILPETPKKNATVVAERIRSSLESFEFKHKDEILHVKASLGVAGHPDDDIANRLDLIAKADEALYKAKAEGRNKVCLYSTEGSEY